MFWLFKNKQNNVPAIDIHNPGSSISQYISDENADIVADTSSEVDVGSISSKKATIVIQPRLDGRVIHTNDDAFESAVHYDIESSVTARFGEAANLNPGRAIDSISTILSEFASFVPNDPDARSAACRSFYKSPANRTPITSSIGRPPRFSRLRNSKSSSSSIEALLRKQIESTSEPNLFYLQGAQSHHHNLHSSPSNRLRINLMVVGRSKSGKTDLINAMFPHEQWSEVRTPTVDACGLSRLFRPIESSILEVEIVEVQSLSIAKTVCELRLAEAWHSLTLPQNSVDAHEKKNRNRNNNNSSQMNRNTISKNGSNQHISNRNLHQRNTSSSSASLFDMDRNFLNVNGHNKQILTGCDNLSNQNQLSPTSSPALKPFHYKKPTVGQTIPANPLPFTMSPPSNSLPPNTHFIQSYSNRKNESKSHAVFDIFTPIPPHSITSHCHTIPPPHLEMSDSSISPSNQDYTLIHSHLMCSKSQLIANHVDEGDMLMNDDVYGGDCDGHDLHAVHIVGDGGDMAVVGDGAETPKFSTKSEVGSPATSVASPLLLHHYTNSADHQFYGFANGTTNHSATNSMGGGSENLMGYETHNIRVASPVIHACLFLFPPPETYTKNKHVPANINNSIELANCEIPADDLYLPPPQPTKELSTVTILEGNTNAHLIARATTAPPVSAAVSGVSEMSLFSNNDFLTVSPRVSSSCNNNNNNNSVSPRLSMASPVQSAVVSPLTSLSLLSACDKEELELLQELNEVVNVIPLLSKADLYDTSIHLETRRKIFQTELKSKLLLNSTNQQFSSGNQRLNANQAKTQLSSLSTSLHSEDAQLLLPPCFADWHLLPFFHKTLRTENPSLANWSRFAAASRLPRFAASRLLTPAVSSMQSQIDPVHSLVSLLSMPLPVSVVQPSPIASLFALPSVSMLDAAPHSPLFLRRLVVELGGLRLQLRTLQLHVQNFREKVLCAQLIDSSRVAVAATAVTSAALGFLVALIASKLANSFVAR